MGAPWFKLFALDYLGDPDVRVLSDADRGILIDCWAIHTAIGGVPMDPEALGKLLHKRPDHAIKAFSRVACFFVDDPNRPGFKLSIRLASEQAAYDNKVHANQENGKRGGRPKKNPLGSETETRDGNPNITEPEPELEKDRVSKDTPPEPPAPAPDLVPEPPRVKPARKPAAPKPAAPTGPNGYLPEEIRPAFWKGLKTFPGQKAINATLAAKAFAEAVGSGQATADELAGCMARYRATFTDDKLQFMTQAHAWLAGAGFMGFLEDERRGKPIPIALGRARGEALTAKGSGFEDYVMPDYVEPAAALRPVPGGF